MSEISLKDLEITQLKEAYQDLKDRLTAKEKEDSAEEIRTLKEKVTRFEERILDEFPCKEINICSGMQ